jgi:hypothetical protein
MRALETGDREHRTPRWRMRFRYMFCMFYPDVVCVSFRSCNDYTYVQVYLSNVSAIFIWMLHVFIWMLYILQWLYAYVISVCSKCFTYFRHMLQVFYLNVTYVAVAIHICCKRMFQFVLSCFNMLQQVLLSTRSDSRARMRCTHQASAAYLCRADKLQQSDVHATGGKCPNYPTLFGQKCICAYRAPERVNTQRMQN